MANGSFFTQFIVFTALILSTFPALAGDQACDDALAKANPVAATAASDLSAFQNGTPMIPGGLQPWSKLPIRNQCFAEICWSYALNEFVDGVSQQSTGEQIITSADHNGFWHLYEQFFNHKQYFNQLTEKVAAGEISKKEAIQQAVRMLSFRRGSATAAKNGWVVDAGSDETIALQEATLYGFVPDSLFTHAITSIKEGNAFQNALNRLIAKVLSSPNLMSTFSSKAADGVNDNLYNFLVTNLKAYYGGAQAHPPYRPNDTFIITNANGTQSTYTPLSYMSQVAKFDPTEFAEVSTTPQNQQLVYQAVHDTLTMPNGPKAVPIGFPVYDQQLAEQQGTFATNTMGQPIVGGHEILIENEIKNSNASIVGSVAQNSWNKGVGLTVDGKSSTDPSQTGYFGVTWDYVSAATAQGEPSSFMLPKSVLQQPQYAGLKISTQGPSFK